MAESNERHQGEPNIRTSGEMIAYGEQLVSEGIALRETNNRTGVQEGSRLIATGEKYIARGNQMRSDLKTPFSPLQVSAYSPRSQTEAQQDDGRDDKAAPSDDGKAVAEDGKKKKKRKKHKKSKDDAKANEKDNSDKRARDNGTSDDAENRNGAEERHSLRATPIDSDVDDLSSADNSLGLRPPRRSEFPLRNRVPDPDAPERIPQKYSASRHSANEMRDAFPAPIDPRDITRAMPPTSAGSASSNDNDPNRAVMLTGYAPTPPEKGFNRVIAVICRVIALLCGALAAVNMVTHHLGTDTTVAILAVGLIFLTFASIEEASARRRIEKRR